MTSPSPSVPASSCRTSSPRLEKVLLVTAVALTVVPFVFLIADRRMVYCHDTFFSYAHQYLTLCHVSEGTGVSLWHPYLSHGLPNNFRLMIQAGLFQNAILFLGGVGQGTSFLPVFHLGMLVDELLLLFGIWMLGRRFFRSPYTRFFVTIAAVGSMFWADQFYFNHRLVYAVPMILHLIHGFFETGSRWRLFLGMNLLTLQLLGNVFYNAVFIATAVPVYFVLFIWILRRRLAGSWHRLRPRWSDLAWGGGTAIGLVTVYLSLTLGNEDVFLRVAGRSPDGTVSLQSFVNFGGTHNPVRYLDFLFGVSPTLDYTLYCGVFTVPLAILAYVGAPGRRLLHLTVFGLVILFFSMGYLSFVAPVAYYANPAMAYFRRVCLVAPLIRLVLILIAGFGVDALLTTRRIPPAVLRGLSAALLVLGILLVGIGGSALAGGTLEAELRRLLLTERPLLASYHPDQEYSIIGPLLTASGAAALAACAFFAWAGRGARSLSVLVLLLLVFQGADVFRWKFQMFSARTCRLDEEEYAAQRVQSLPFVARRTDAYRSAPRVQLLGDKIENHGIRYDSSEAYYFVEPELSRLWSRRWMKAREELDRSLGLRWKEAPPPEARGVAGKIRGVVPGKLQLFSAGHGVPSGESLDRMLRSHDYRGDMLLLLTPDAASRAEGAGARSPGRWLAADERVSTEWEILHFDANTLRVKFDVPEDLKDAWMFYSDAWHSGWKATVNGKEVEIARAFGAYKAVPVGAGSNTVEFRFVQPLRTFLFNVLGLNSLAWVAGLVIALFMAFVRRETELSPSPEAAVRQA